MRLYLTSASMEFCRYYFYRHYSGTRSTNDNCDPFALSKNALPDNCHYNGLEALEA
jgi:hypothetical protein